MDTIIFQTEPLEDFYELKEELGRGNFAVVKRCEKKETSEEYAAKCITKKRSKASKRGMSKEAVEIEAGLLLALDHEAIIKLYDVFETKTNITLIMELLTGGELFEEIAKEEFILEKDACHYTKQVLNAIQHMHERNIVHLDLKPENIVLQYPGSKTIKLIDFGLAKMIEPGKEIREMMGTPEFAAPEVIHYDIVGFYTDMWALGVVTYILLSGASPFLGDDDQETYKNISSCEYQFDDEYFDEITKNAKDFIEKLLVKNPKDRNTVQDSLNHPWIALEKDENSVIDTQKMRAFVARRRWKQSLKLVSTISRLKILCRNSTPSPTSDVSGDEGSRVSSPTSPNEFNSVDSERSFSPEEEKTLEHGISNNNWEDEKVHSETKDIGGVCESNGTIITQNEDAKFSQTFVSAEYTAAQHANSTAVLIPYPEAETGVQAVITSNIGSKKTLLPEQTVTALSENLPWDPEGDLSPLENGKHFSEHYLSLNGFKVPTVQKQLIPDVRLRTEDKTDVWCNTTVSDEGSLQVNNNTYNMNTSRMNANRLSPEMAEFNQLSCLDVGGNSAKSVFDRKKQRTIRKINWETNYIPPLDFIQQSQPVRPPTTVKKTKMLGKETSV